MLVLLLVAFSLPAAVRADVPGQQIVSQATYVMDSIKWPSKNLAEPKPSDVNIVIHLEVTTSPWDDGAYHLRGWVKTDVEGKHREMAITSGKVREDGVPDRMLWQSSVMGEPNWQWIFYFQKGGRMEIWNQKNNIRYEMHKQ